MNPSIQAQRQIHEALWRSRPMAGTPRLSPRASAPASPGALAVLREELAVLHTAIALLEIRLGPVLRREPSVASRAEPSPVAQPRLRELAQKAHAAVARLQGLLDRVDL